MKISRGSDWLCLAHGWGLLFFIHACSIFYMSESPPSRWLPSRWLCLLSQTFPRSACLHTPYFPPPAHTLLLSKMMLLSVIPVLGMLATYCTKSKVVWIEPRSFISVHRAAYLWEKERSRVEQLHVLWLWSYEAYSIVSTWAQSSNVPLSKAVGSEWQSS